jgi:hypothetical protein
MAAWEDVRRLVFALPETAEKTSYGNSAWTVGGKLFVWERPLRKGDFEALGSAAPRGPILGVRTEDLEQKEAMLASDPKVFFTTPHFDGYAAVLVQLDKIAVKKLSVVILDAWLSAAPKRIAAAYALTGAKASAPAKKASATKTSATKTSAKKTSAKKKSAPTARERRPKA